jgi:hypothetical protein
MQEFHLLGIDNHPGQPITTDQVKGLIELVNTHAAPGTVVCIPFESCCALLFMDDKDSTKEAAIKLLSSCSGLVCKSSMLKQAVESIRQIGQLPPNNVKITYC